MEQRTVQVLHPSRVVVVGTDELEVRADALQAVVTRDEVVPEGFSVRPEVDSCVLYTPTPVRPDPHRCSPPPTTGRLDPPSSVLSRPLLSLWS